MDEYYCGMCSEKHPVTIENVSCPKCGSRYCLELLEGVIYTGSYNCPTCNYPFEKFTKIPDALKEEIKVATFPQKIVKTISKIVKLNGSRNIPLQQLRMFLQEKKSTNGSRKVLENNKLYFSPNSSVEIVEETLGKLIEEGKIRGWIEGKEGTVNMEKDMLVLGEEWNVEETKRKKELITEIAELEQKSYLIRIPSRLEQLLELSILTDQEEQQWKEYKSEIEVRIEEAKVLQEIENQIKQKIPKVDEINRQETTGYTMNKNNHVISLGIYEQDLVSLPETLGQLTNLKKLDLRWNKLTSLPETLGQLTNLKILYLLDNQLTSLPETLGQLTKLEELYLGVIQLASLPETLGQLTNLKKLDLRVNQLASLPETLGQLTNLKELHLGVNQWASNLWASLPETLIQWLRDLKRKGCTISGVYH